MSAPAQTLRLDRNRATCVPLIADLRRQHRHDRFAQSTEVGDVDYNEAASNDSSAMIVHASELIAIICPAFVVSGKLYASRRLKSCRLFDDASG